jgi:nucleoside-diphosphate-sugar epimerase
LKVLVTGANGFVGKNLCAYLSKDGFEVLRTDVCNSDVDGDLTDRSFVINSLTRMEFDSVVHLAALANIPKSLEDPSGCYRVNCFGTLNLLELAAGKRLDRFVYTSSNNVYGPPKRLPVREDDPYNPRSPYDYSKVVAEQFVKSFHLHKQVPTVVLRSWNMFGPHDVPGRAVPRFITACTSGQPIPLYNGGRDSDDFYYVENYCKAVALALKNPRAVGEVFNVGTGGNVTVRDLAEMVKRLTGSGSKLEILPPRTELERRPRRTRPSIQKTRRILGYGPVVPLKEGLEQTIRWFKKETIT